MSSWAVNFNSMIFFCVFVYFCQGTGTNAATSNHNHNITPTNNFKRQNTVDSATIKENTARISAASAAAAGTGTGSTTSSRPASAAVKTANTPVLDVSGKKIWDKL